MLYYQILRENIIEDFYLTPDYFEKELNTKFGSGFSIQPKFTQSAYFRFHNKSEICDGLYFVGAGTHPGAGVPGVLSSAKVLDKIIIMIKKITLSIYAKSFNWAGFFLPKNTY